MLTVNLLPFVCGAYVCWYSLRVGMFNYESQYEVANMPSKDKQIYWGAIPLFCIGLYLITTAFVTGA